ncbi:O-antigen ligase family protein, partial [bacterium]|nr:O-antigen ligase family protein [bacterium]
MILLFFIEYFSEVNHRRFYIISISVVATITSIYGIMQYLGVDLYSMFRGFAFWKNYSEKRRIFSTIGNPNFLASVLLFSIPVCDEIYKTAKNKLEKKLSIFGIILMLICFVMTKSFGAFLVMAIYLGGILFHNIWKKSKVFWSVSIIVLCLGLSFIQTTVPGKKLCKKIETKLKIRMYIWNISVEMLKEKLLLGRGPGMFKKDFQEHMVKYNRKHSKTLNIGLPRAFKYVHNEIIQGIIEWGLIGIVLFIFFLFQFMESRSLLKF